MSVNGNSQTLEKDFVFKQLNQGTSKKNGRPFTMIELHDSTTLDNTSFFIPDGHHVDVTGINFKDRVTASFTMDIMWGKPQLVLTKLAKK